MNKFFKFIPTDSEDGYKFASISKELVEKEKDLMMFYHNNTFPSGIKDIVEADRKDPDFIEYLKTFSVAVSEDINKKQKWLSEINHELFEYNFTLVH